MRKLDVMNMACLGKLGWKLQSESNDLLCSVLHCKYIEVMCNTVEISEQAIPACGKR
jgi:hypothetical protein